MLGSGQRSFVVCWCVPSLEQLTAQEKDSKLCYCWTKTQTECMFYHVPESHLAKCSVSCIMIRVRAASCEPVLSVAEVSTPPATPCWNHSSVENVYPRLEEGFIGRTGAVQGTNVGTASSLLAVSNPTVDSFMATSGYA